MWIVDIICTRSIAFFPVFLSVSGFYRFNRWYWIGLDFLWKTASLKTSLIVPNIFWTAFRSPIPSPSSSSGGCDISVVSSSDLIFITSLITWPTQHSSNTPSWNSPPVQILNASSFWLKKSFLEYFWKGIRQDVPLLYRSWSIRVIAVGINSLLPTVYYQIPKEMHRRSLQKASERRLSPRKKNRKGRTFVIEV